MSVESFFGWFFSIIGCAVITFLIGLGMIGAAGAVRSDGSAKYCFIDQREGTFWVVAVRPWCPDRRIAHFGNAEDALRFASQIGCPIK